MSTIIVTSEKHYAHLAGEYEEMKAERDVLKQEHEKDTKKLFEASIERETLRSQGKVLAHYLGQQLSHIERKFNSNEDFDSLEEAYNYLAAARYLHENFGRTENEISAVQIWVDNNCLPFGK